MLSMCMDACTHIHSHTSHTRHQQLIRSWFPKGITRNGRFIMRRWHVWQALPEALKWMRWLCPWHEATLLRLQCYRRPAGSSAALQGQLLLGGWMHSCLACVLTLLNIWSLSFSKADTGVYSQASTEDMADSSEFSSSNFILHPSLYLIRHSFSFMQFTFPQSGCLQYLKCLE